MTDFEFWDRPKMLSEVQLKKRKKQLLLLEKEDIKKLREDEKSKTDMMKDLLKNKHGMNRYQYMLQVQQMTQHFESEL